MSTWPLYAGHGFDSTDVAGSSQWALRFMRGFGGYQDNFGHPDEKSKNAFLQQFHGSKAGDAESLQRHAERTRKLVHSLGGICFPMVADERIMTGLGNSHALENGMTWHPSFGVPYFCGAAVKGLTRAFLSQWLDQSPLRAHCETLFGISPEHAQRPEIRPDDFFAGALTFFDLVPMEPVTLVAEVMTPHYGKWYLEGGSRPGIPQTIPADWHDPTPIGVLAVEQNATFQLALAVRLGAQLPEGATLEQVADVAADAFTWLGIGAKTAVGYGRLHREVPEPSASPGAARLEALHLLRENDRRIDRGGLFVKEVNAVLHQIDLFTPEECAALVLLLEETFKRYEWKRGKEAAKHERLDAFRAKARPR